MRYVKFWGDNGYAGCDWEEFQQVDADTTDEELDTMAGDLAYDYAESYEHVAEGYDMDEGWESEEDEDEYYQNIDYGWKYISEEEYREGLAN